jgi:4,5-dihydroxyphthalate decarboxylase
MAEADQGLTTLNCYGWEGAGHKGVPYIPDVLDIPEQIMEIKMANLRLSFGCWDYDRTRALAEETVRPDGIELTCLNMPVEETFFRMLRHREFDLAEMSLSSYVLSLNDEKPPFIAIKKPKDLIGKRIGTPEFQMTAAVWIRGILAEEYGVPVDSVTYVTGGEESPGRPEKLPLRLPANIKVERIGPTQTLSQMLQTGEIDALHTARMPSSYADGSGRIRRLFENYAEVEQAYYEKTKIFPIMHTVVIRRDVYERNRWIAQSLYKAFVAAQKIAYEDLHQTAALKTMLPWLTDHVEQVEKLLGKDFWPYGLQSNQHVLKTFLRYSHQQGLAQKLYQPEDLFAPETFEAFVI